MKRGIVNVTLVAAQVLFLSVSSYATTLPPNSASVTLDGVDIRDYTYEQLLTVFATIAERRHESFRLEIKAGEKTFEYDAEDLGWETNALDLVNSAWAARTSGELKTVTSFDWAKVQQVVQEVWEEGEVEPEPPTLKGFDSEAKEFQFKEGTPGQKLDYETCRELIYAACNEAEDGGSKTVNIPVTVVQPETKTANIKAEYGLMGKYTTTTTNVPNRNINIDLCSKELSGTILEPEDIFSFNGLLGWTSPERGFKEAGTLVNGKPSTGLGGGICQVSSTLYNAVDEAGLTIVERHAHSAPVGYVPVGRDATVSYGTLDFRFKNSTSDKVYIVIDYTNNVLTCSVYGKKTEV